MRRRLATTFASVIALFGATATAASACPGDAQIPGTGTGTVAQAHAAILCLVNQQRAGHGLGGVQENPALDHASQRHTHDMVDHGYFAHVSPDAGDLVARLRSIGYITPSETWSVGENIAYGDGTLSTPAAIVGGWMQSPEHRANILNGAFSEMGVGVASSIPIADGSGLLGATYTTDFGSRTGGSALTGRGAGATRHHRQVHSRHARSAHAHRHHHRHGRARRAR